MVSKAHMWSWFGVNRAAAEATAQPTTEETDDIVIAHDLTCAELVDTVKSMSSAEFAHFLVLARNHNIDYMSKHDVEELFARYTEAASRQTLPAGVAPEPCSPRQLAEFLYLLTPPRWELFKTFASFYNINTLPFTTLITTFLNFEAAAVAAASGASR
jgi:hypothetical protein